MRITMKQSKQTCQIHYTEAAVQRFLKKRCSENMQQIYRRTPMQKCDFNKLASQLY